MTLRIARFLYLGDALPAVAGYTGSMKPGSQLFSEAMSSVFHLDIDKGEDLFESIMSKLEKLGIGTQTLGDSTDLSGLEDLASNRVGDSSKTDITDILIRVLKAGAFACAAYVVATVVSTLTVAALVELGEMLIVIALLSIVVASVFALISILKAKFDALMSNARSSFDKALSPEMP